MATSSCRGAERSTRRLPSAEPGCPEYMASSLAAASASATPSTVCAWSGRMRATTTAAARRGEMPVAMSRGVVPRATVRWLPSGSWIEMVSWLTLSA